MTSTANASTVSDQLLHACQVISLDAKISEWLGENDPKALVQIRQAIKRAQTVTGTDTGGLSITTAVNRQMAFAAVDRKFASVLDITFAEHAEQAAIIGAVEELASTLMVRGRGRLAQRLGADIQRLISGYHVEQDKLSTQMKGN